MRHSPASIIHTEVAIGCHPPTGISYARPAALLPFALTSSRVCLLATDSTIDRASNLQDRWFDSWLGTVTQWPWASYFRPCAFIDKQYNLVASRDGDAPRLVRMATRWPRVTDFVVYRPMVSKADVTRQRRAPCRSLPFFYQKTNSLDVGIQLRVSI